MAPRARRQFSTFRRNMSRGCFAILWSLSSLFLFPGCSGCEQQTVEPEQVETNPDAQPIDEPSVEQPETTAEAETQTQSRESASRRFEHPRPSTTAEDSSSSKSAGGPAEALREARELRSEAREEQAAGNHGEAFRKATQAWSLVNEFPEDRECRSLAEALLTELDGLAAQANRQNAGAAALGDKTLIEK